MNAVLQSPEPDKTSLQRADEDVPTMAGRDDHFSLPAWIYSDPDFFRAELRTIFRRSWQIQTLIREIAYAHPDGRREMRAARYLNWRINRQVNIEDKALIERVQAGMGSSSYTVGPLGEGEVSLRSFGRRMRELIPQSRLHRAPPSGWGA